MGEARSRHKEEPEQSGSEYVFREEEDGQRGWSTCMCEVVAEEAGEGDRGHTSAGLCQA